MTTQKPYQVQRIGALMVIILSFQILSYGNDTLKLDLNFKKEKLSSYITVFDTLALISPTEALEIVNQPNKFKPVHSTSFGFSRNYFWITFMIQNTTDTTLQNVIAIRNPHIDLLKAWQLDTTNTLSLLYKGGDILPFYERTFINRNLITPLRLAPKSSLRVLLMVDKRNASVSAPIEIINQQKFETDEKNAHFFYGIYAGILLVIIVFSIFVYRSQKQIIFFWYAFYIFFLGLYLIAHTGILFQIVYPNFNWFNNFSRPVFITFSSSALIHFIRLFLNVKQLLPSLNKYYNYLIYILNISTLWWISTPWWYETQTMYYLNTQNITLFFSLILVLLSSILTFNHQKVIVSFFWISFLAVLFAGMSIILIELGVVTESVTNFNPLFIGSLIEVIVFAIGLSYWAKIKNSEKNQLTLLVEKSKKQMVESYINGIEMEKQKISSDLHDEIGSRLSYLKHLAELKETSEIANEFRKIAKKVRSLSHDLAPPSFSNMEFILSINHLVKSCESTQCNINLQVFDIPNSVPSKVTTHLYRIVQTALGAIEKYTNTTSIDLQFFYHNNEIVLAIETNKTSLNLSEEGLNIEITEIKSRVATMNGNLDITSSESNGASILIAVPI